jgi:hypothetical protein
MANKDEELKYEKDDFHKDIAHTNYDLAENKGGKELSSPNIGKTLLKSECIYSKNCYYFYITYEKILKYKIQFSNIF